MGLLPGEGVGPELTDAAMKLLGELNRLTGAGIELVEGPGSGEAAQDGSLTATAAGFCAEIFERGGVVLAGPHGGRWVYEMRSRFDLYCKLSPVRSELAVNPPSWIPVSGFDQVIVREQAAGIYQGSWEESDGRDGGRATHTFSYTKEEVERIVAVGLALAEQRSGRIAVVVKEAGVPSISRLFASCARELAASRSGLELELIDIDFAGYRMLREPGSLDVIVAPNLFGDILSDLGGILLGSRGMCFGASFAAGGAAVYQTNHGSAHDLAGSARANPTAHLLSAAMLLRESFGLEREAAALERALIETVSGRLAPPDLGGEAAIGEIVAAVAERLGELVDGRVAR